MCLLLPVIELLNTYYEAPTAGHNIELPLRDTHVGECDHVDLKHIHRLLANYILSEKEITLGASP